MKPDSDKLHTLLHEVLPPAGEHCGPSSAAVLHLLREDRRRRRTRRRAALVAGFTAVLSAMAWMPRGPSATRTAAPASPPPAPALIRQVNDAQLFALLQDTPAALVRSPDGTSRLLVLDR